MQIPNQIDGFIARSIPLHEQLKFARCSVWIETIDNKKSRNVQVSLPRDYFDGIKVVSGLYRSEQSDIFLRFEDKGASSCANHDNPSGFGE